MKQNDMTIKKYIDDVRESIAENDLDKAIQQLRSLFNNSPKLDEVILQSSRFQDIRRQIRLSIVSNTEANLMQDQIRAALLDLLKEIEFQKQMPAVKEEIERTLSIINSKNVVLGGIISENENVEIGDRKIGISDITGNGNISIQGNYGPVKIVHNVFTPKKVKTATDLYLKGVKYANEAPPNINKAIENFTAATRKNKKFVDAYIARGRVRMEGDDYETAIWDFKEALSLSPKHCDAMYLLAVSFVQTKDFERAFNWLEKALELNCGEKKPYIKDLHKELEKNKKE